MRLIALGWAYLSGEKCTLQTSFSWGTLGKFETPFVVKLTLGYRPIRYLFDCALPIEFADDFRYTRVGTAVLGVYV